VRSSSNPTICRLPDSRRHQLPAIALILVAVNDATGIVEHYNFRLDERGNGQVAWGSVKGAGSPIQKSMVLHAVCKAA
jgi:hypothetical protein